MQKFWKLRSELKTYKDKIAYQILDKLWFTSRDVRRRTISKDLEADTILGWLCNVQESTRKYLISKIPALKPLW
ncbi:hypothetical protein COOONC_13702 [Cooperia oncophora]